MLHWKMDAYLLNAKYQPKVGILVFCAWPQALKHHKCLRGYFCCSGMGLFHRQSAPNASWVILFTDLLWGCYIAGTFPASTCAGSSCSLGDHCMLIGCHYMFRNKFSIGQSPLTFWNLGDEMHSLPISFSLFVCLICFTSENYVSVLGV